MGLIQRALERTKEIVDFGRWFIEIDEQIMRPAKQATDKVATTYHAWHHAEIARGASVTTDPPSAVNERVAKINHDRAQALRRYALERQPAITAEVDRLYDEVIPLLEPAVEAMDRLRRFKRQYERLCALCGVAPDPIVVAEDAISVQGVEIWKSQIAQVKAQRARWAAAATAQRTPTPLELGD